MKKLLLLICLVPSIYSSQNITVNLNHGDETFSWHYRDAQQQIICAYCQKDISQEESCVISFDEKYPFAYFLCKDCNDKYDDIAKKLFEKKGKE